MESTLRMMLQAGALIQGQSITRSIPEKLSGLVYRPLGLW
jgi:hypothetical protein